MSKPKSAKRRAQDLRTQFEEIKKTAFWQAYETELLARYEQAVNLLVTKTDADEAKLRVAATMVSSLRTVLNLPRMMLEAADTEVLLEQADQDATQEMSYDDE